MGLTYLVKLRSKPGMYAQYSKQVVVTVDDDYDGHEHEIFMKAVQKVNRGEFSDRPASMWLLENMERINE